MSTVWHCRRLCLPSEIHTYTWRDEWLWCLQLLHLLATGGEGGRGGGAEKGETDGKQSTWPARKAGEGNLGVLSAFLHAGITSQQGQGFWSQLLPIPRQ